MSQHPVTIDDIFELFRESERQRKEQQREFEQSLQEYRKTSEQEMAELKKIVAQTNKQVGGITSRWGEFVENLVRPAAVRMFHKKGIEVHFTALRVEAQDENGSIEIDVLAENTNEVVAIEVKSHLEVRDVKRFLITLDRFKQALPKYQSYKLYGAIAGIKVDERADEYATQEGLFLIKPSGNTVAIANGQDFVAKTW
ncbi:MAG: DUF3782 domain-containing protein [Pseudanabaena sp. M090S1SP1A06QC]|jgi:hypothetical protein|nr:DUF3782 domain-containing protein [Pseudanabaena sp. M53BS1SP1A06MG]MCA6583418.1 DUF3782 domain-containing protein [Pseudanabaena sp. M34BS1SP1A06MG]MCA6585635.1 DUF3782 domain-containing protein [Pseudanabaena sp. M051S1SP1A06QC]MCA6588158.1 DUF3782 domain-containing protein [Pseudanabaena sp. M109S1SP1A06QC]MCA6593184.1 DUF3782 domain-containing protein [Pseudanabaena sp. M38BS1SP1A06MG]MCA6602230.1 DUF3782 domain-containing protein [Pseudanabaena sp. M57BS1SP1A06MG]MCA6605683.1 DUF3782 